MDNPFGRLMVWRVQENRFAKVPGMKFYEALLTPEGGGNVIATVGHGGPAGTAGTKEAVREAAEFMVDACNRIAALERERDEVREKALEEIERLPRIEAGGAEWVEIVRVRMAFKEYRAVLDAPKERKPDAGYEE